MFLLNKHQGCLAEAGLYAADNAIFMGSEVEQMGEKNG